MSASEFDFNIDSILEEFSLYSESIGGVSQDNKEPPKAAPAVPRVYSAASEPPAYERPSAHAAANPDAEEYVPRRRPAAQEWKSGKSEPNTRSENHRRGSDEVHTARKRISHTASSHSRDDYDLDAFYKLREEVKKASPPKGRSLSDEEYASTDALREKARPVRHSAEIKAEAPRSGRGIRESASLRPAPEESSRRHAGPEAKPRTVSPLTPVLGIICSLLIVIGLAWVLFNVHPGATAVSADGPSQKLDMVSRLDVYLNNMASDALGDLSYIRRVYKIDENATFAPAPNQNRYGILSVGEADKVLDIIQAARDSGLLEQQDICFSPDANFYWASDIQYYYDETILVICWKEQIDGKVCSFVEVKVADASQFRRKITEDSYGSSVKQYASQLSASANAVVAMNADFYAFRTLGMVVYQRQLYRYNPSNYNSLDHCFIDSSGNFQFVYRWTEMSEEDVKKYLEDNDILFGLAFGPVLVDNGQVVPCDSYPAGEINTEYSRAGIGQLDALHYLYMTVNWSDENTPRATVGEFANIFHSKGVKNAYCLDGGQTSEIVMNDIPYNRIDFNAERPVSDIIYFATAIPESEVTK